MLALLTPLRSQVFRGHNEPVLNVAMNYDGTRFASTDNSGTCIVWDPKVEHPIHILKEHTDIVYVRSRGGGGLGVALFSNAQRRYCCVFGKEAKDGKGRLITAGHDNRICVWDSYLGTVIGEVDSRHSSWITAAALDVSNMQLATVSMDARTSLILWQSLPPVPKNWDFVDKGLRAWKRLKRFLGIN